MGNIKTGFRRFFFVSCNEFLFFVVLFTRTINRMILNRRSLLLPVIFCFQILFGQTTDINDEIQRKVITAERISSPIKIDGIIDEEAWSTSSVAENFVERSPENGKPEPKDYRTKVKMLFDDSGVYFAAELSDPNPENIRKELAERDNIANDDFFAISINGYNDRQQGAFFIIQASGVQADAKIFHNANDDYSWNAVWYSAVKIHDDGWTVEAKIPFSELRFPNKNPQEWGINFMRVIQKSNLELTWNFVDNKKANYMYYDGILHGITDVKTPTRLSFLPYFSTYLNNYDNKTSANVNGGMDLKYGINDAFTLDLTLIPDFGQANFDAAVLNLGPFEQQYEENRSFFTEGTELFNKGNLFYSRRVGGAPSFRPEISEHEEFLDHPEKVKLFNAVKISGRTNKGLGLGFFNGITEKTEAVIKDINTGETRSEVIEPWANYNVFVVDQRFKNNSSVSLVNTNVTRDGHFRDANVTALLFEVGNSKNTYKYYGNAKESIVNDGEMKYGTEAALGFNKIAGKSRFGGSTNFRTKNYDIDDLGYTGGNNYIEYEAFYNYRYLKPRGNLNSLFYNVTVDLFNRLEKSLFSSLGIHQTLELQNKKFQNFGLGLYVQPFGSNNIYEAREFGRHLEVPAMVNSWIFYNSDSRKKFAYGGYTEIYVHDETGRIRYVSELNTRYRFSDHFSLSYEFDYDIYRNDVGYAAKLDSDIIMGRRNRNTFVNGLSGSYIFNDKMSLNLAFRHYYSSVMYNRFSLLNNDGGLEETQYSNNHNGTYNFWNIDLRYSWWFAPGSNLTLMYRNSADSFMESSNPKFKNNFDYLFSKPQLNTLSLKVTYFLDYNRMKSWIKRG